MSIKTPHELRKKLVELAADGWEPAPSGNGNYLYMHKGGSYNPPGIYGPMMCGACDTDFTGTSDPAVETFQF